MEITDRFINAAFKQSAAAGDKQFVSTFLDNATRIMETAQRTEGGELAILIDDRGAIRIVADPDWPLASLISHHGAREGYRVTRDAGKIRVEGRSRSQWCALENDSTSPARPWLVDQPVYRLANCCPASAPRMLVT